MGAEPQADPALALPRRRAGDARAAEGGRRPEGGAEARPRADARDRQRALAGEPLQDEEDVLATGAALYAVMLGRARARPGLLLAHARRCFAPPRAGPRPASARTSASSGSSTSAIRARSRGEGARPAQRSLEPTCRSSAGDHVDGEARCDRSRRDDALHKDRLAALAPRAERLQRREELVEAEREAELRDARHGPAALSQSVASRDEPVTCVCFGFIIRT